jgi:aminopeptidase-like protein
VYQKHLINTLIYQHSDFSERKNSMTISPQQASRDTMWSLITDLFPVYRSLVSPGFKQSLDIIEKQLPLTITEIPSGTKCFDWTIPKEYRVHESFVEAPSGERIFDFADCNYHVWLYSQPFQGEMKKDEFIKNVATSSALADAIPLRHAYYQKKWGISASQKQVIALQDGTYKINVNTEHVDGQLRIAEYYLPGDSKEEIMITSYLCHPRGANDNLSGVVVSVELFRLLAQLPNRRYSYRLLIIPETIGSIAYIHHFRERLKNVIGGYVCTCVGDPGTLHYKHTFEDNTLIDRAAMHVLKYLDKNYGDIKYSHSLGSDECQFNAAGVRLPFGSIMRTPYGVFPQYHTSLDDLTYVTADALLGTLQAYWHTLMALEHNFVYKINEDFVVDPFMSSHGVYPYSYGGGEGGVADEVGRAYYEFMGFTDGKHDLISIADRTDIFVHHYTPAAKDFLEKGLVTKI